MDQPLLPLLPSERETRLDLEVILDPPADCIRLEWRSAASRVLTAVLEIRCTGRNELTWTLRPATGQPSRSSSTLHRTSIRARLRHTNRLLPAKSATIRPLPPTEHRGRADALGTWEPSVPPTPRSLWPWLEGEIHHMGYCLKVRFSPLGRMLAPRPPMSDDFARQLAWDEEKRRREAERRAQRLAEWQQRRQARQAKEQTRRAVEAAKRVAQRLAPPALERAPVPPVPLRVEVPSLQFQDTLLPLADLRRYFLLEQAQRWWISNQSDDLLALPYCRIEHLDYQCRTALRVIGPLRGRALLSDEVGLGKTIEAGLVIKEYLTRGMIKRFLVLTVPSLVDQWEEELEEKFGLPCVTTNHAAFRSDATAFWTANPALIASLHTLKQPAHLAVAQTINWDLLVVDEAHYLRNRSSQAWQAVNALPRQFLLLLTATPVQNSLEELYNLVTLLQPGQLPSPKEFRDRFINRKQPHQPREPEELRRLLGQVMVRNTRANAGVKLPARHAETVLFAPESAELEFWQRWETELRTHLQSLNPSQASLWGRLLLQAAGSSPAAWQEALRSFPVRAAAEGWQAAAPLASSWAKKSGLVIPLARGEGGVVVFTQFLETQAALARQLEAAKVPTWVINGQTPAAERQPITEQFRRHAGALLLTHSGTEGRNLQFCHRLVNFDLPWNPMEIEQRIGRLHRLGQQHPVRIYNLVQQQTLQEHLLELLQEKLNLFELVVGETGLILGERFSSDEFAAEVFRRWRDSAGRVAEAFQSLGEELTAARGAYQQVRQLDDTLFAHDYETQ